MEAERLSRSRTRRPQERVGRNTEALLEAAERILADSGWGGLNFAAIAEQAGLSRRTLQDRFAGPSAVAAAVWKARSGPALERCLRALVEATGPAGNPVERRDRLGEALEEMVRPGIDLLAASELLIMSQFDPDLRRAVARSAGRRVGEWCKPEAGGLTRARAGGRAFLISLGLGLVLTARTPGSDQVDISAEVQHVWDALGEERRPVALPKARAKHLDGPTLIETGDPIRDALLTATLESVGAVGYEATTVSMVAAASGYTQGAIFGRYATKLEMFADATRIQQEAGTRANHEYIEAVVEQSGRGVAEAVAIREFQRPGREHLRAILLEQMRVMWHQPEMLDAHAAEIQVALEVALEANPQVGPERAGGAAHFGYALGLGTVALALLDPACWTLPFDVMTVPLSG